MQLTTGALQKRWARQHIKARKAGKRRKKDNHVGSNWTKIFPSNLNDILDFRTQAFDGDQISPQVIRDIGNYLFEKDMKENTPEHLHNLYILGAMHLENTLQDVTPKVRSYTKFNPGDSIDFITRLFWHTKYSPEDRVKIAEEYKTRVSEDWKNLSPRLKDRKTLLKLHLTILRE